MKKDRIQWMCLLVSCAILSSCSSVALTGRKQLMLVSDEQVMSLSEQSYTDYMKTATLSTDKKNTEMVVACR
jgi:hypothetical protein